MKKKIIVRLVVIAVVVILVAAAMFFSYLNQIFNGWSVGGGTPCVFDAKQNIFLDDDISKTSGYKKDYDYEYKVAFFLDDAKSESDKAKIIKDINAIAKKNPNNTDLLDLKYSNLSQKIDEKCVTSDEGNLSDSVQVNASDKNLGKPLNSFTVTATAWYYPASFGGGWHPGIDMGTPIGSKIYAPANGVILLQSTNPGGYGTFMVIEVQSGDKVYTMLFGHMSRYKLKTGAIFNKGDVIGYSGNTGNSTGPHVHMEIELHKADFNSVYNQFKRSRDYYYGLGYQSLGDCSKVCRLKPHEVYGYKYNHSY